MILRKRRIQSGGSSAQEKDGGDFGSRTATAWEVLPGQDATQVTPEHILHFFLTLFEDYGLYELYEK